MLVGSVEHRVVVLEEFLPDDKVHARRSAVADPRVVVAAGDAKVGVLVAGDEVLRGGQAQLGAADGE